VMPLLAARLGQDGQGSFVLEQRAA